MIALNKLLSKSVFLNNRIISYLAILLILQCIIAYSALLVFDSLPKSITDVPDDKTVLYETQRGTVTLILNEIDRHKDQPVETVIQSLQPYFGYPINVLPMTKKFRSSTKMNQFQFSVDDENDILYIPLNANKILKLGPILIPSILESNTLSFSFFILLWSAFSAVICFILIYFAFRTFWNDLFKMRHVAEQIGSGNLKARVNHVNSWLLKSPSNILNTMATHIEHLVMASQIISHAMAHELRTPLARIRFALGMYENEENSLHKKTLLHSISSDVDELESSIKTSLTYFKMQRNKIELNLKTVSLQEWCNELCESLLPLKPDEFTFHYYCQDKKVAIDTKLADTVTKNLLLNAFKYANNKIILNISLKNEMVIITVDDDGPGIPLNDREKIFMPFFRLNIKKTVNKEGYGLGLAYVKLICEFHYGNTFVMTSALGGARFVATLKTNP